MADEWAMLSRRSEKWLWLTKTYVRWWAETQSVSLNKNLNATGMTRLQLFLDQRHTLSQGWNTAYRNNWVTRFNDFYLFALTTRVVG